MCFCSQITSVYPNVTLSAVMWFPFFLGSLTICQHIPLSDVLSALEKRVRSAFNLLADGK